MGKVPGKGILKLADDAALLTKKSGKPLESLDNAPGGSTLWMDDLKQYQNTQNKL